MIHRGRSIQQIDEHPTSYDTSYTIYKVRSYLGAKPYNPEPFANEEPDITDDHVEHVQLQDHPKGQGQELINISLVEE